ncbi:putative iron hydrogenase [Encephalitozoon intestinalis ATCC 50506]|uniref:Iron hydrogenase n=1 Tax=Encephalitozoon intestinalis (strain ATCC 50506) TaxID=876142 RepID=E0S7C0_ENCIT|nr:putative iron hydrogenase [Encephalitozoon intestinalis ATCC 50506]ADM11548.1 putative iron hydrogenase [Encephalitozoon intestinalis ATCC 50506]UTX45262.1 iron hydrogenase [Encephalitozoon intestinalis]
MSFFAGLSKNNQKCIKTDTPFNLSLSDCLACSGCVTTDEAGALSADISFVRDSAPQTSFVLSPQSKVNIFNIYGKGNMSYREFEGALSSFLRAKLNVRRIVDTSSMRRKIYKEIYKEYLATDHLVISACPGVVAYVERTAPHLIDYLSRVKSPQQMAFSLVKGDRTVSVMPCQDKKLESGRDGVKFDHVLTTREFRRVLDELEFELFLKANSWNHHEIEDMEVTQWNIGTSSGGYAEFILSKHRSVKKIKDRNGIREYMVDDGGIVSQITGLENSINYFKISKTKGPKYKMAEVFLCKNSCIGGPGQERINSVEVDSAEYNIYGKEQPEIYYSDPGLEEKRTFRPVSVKRIDFKVDW